MIPGIETAGPVAPGAAPHRAVLLAVAYLALCLGASPLIALFEIGPGASALFAISGLTVAAVLVGGIRVLPAVALATWIDDPGNPGQWLHVARHLSVYGGVALLLRHYRPDVVGLSSPRHVGLFVTTAAAAAGLSGLLATLHLAVAGGLGAYTPRDIFLSFALGDLCGIVAVAPLGLIAFRLLVEPGIRRGAVPLPPVRLMVGWMAVAAVATGFLALADGQNLMRLLPWHVYAVLVCLSALHGHWPLSVSLALAGNMLGVGVFGDVLRAVPVLDVQVAVLGTNLAGLLVATAVAGRDRAIAELDAHRRDLEATVADRTAELEAANDLLATRLTATRELAEDRDRARIAAERANAAKTRFMASASHDLKQPLNSVSLLLGMLDEDREGSRLAPDIAAAATGIRASLASSLELFDGLLDYARLESGQVQPTPEPLRLQAILARLSAELAGEAAQRGLAFRVVRTRAGVVSDPMLLTRILRNLTVNALRYTRSGGVLVGVRRRGDLWRVDVVDTGPGIPEDRQAAIFDAFARLDTQEHGHGLGLAIVRDLSRLLGHRVELSSRPGRGTRFSVYLPRA